ncbi:MAG TPA: hypothetical protein VFR27_04365 [Mycobacterium sp.]|nr:hypothetical protein [Mycobacterium sp.]
MRVSNRAKLGATGVLALAGALLIAGCGATVDGRPVAAPGAGPTLSTPAPRPGPPAPGGTIALPPDGNGYVFIETKSGKTRCQISPESVGCEADFTNSPVQDGQHANGVSISSDGTVVWILGNLGAIPVVTIDYRTYDAQGWTIAASIDGTRFTNDHTGHGMFVSIDNVETF